MITPLIFCLASNPGKVKLTAMKIDLFQLSTGLATQISNSIPYIPYKYCIGIDQGFETLKYLLQ